MISSTPKSKTLLQLHQSFTCFFKKIKEFPHLRNNNEVRFLDRCGNRYRLGKIGIQYTTHDNRTRYCENFEVLSIIANVCFSDHHFVKRRPVFNKINILIPMRDVQNIEWTKLQNSCKPIQNIIQVNTFYQTKKIVQSNEINYLLSINNQLCNFLTLHQKFQTPKSLMTYKNLFTSLLYYIYVLQRKSFISIRKYNFNYYPAVI